MAPGVVWIAERFAVVSGDHHERVLREIARAQPVEEPPDLPEWEGVRDRLQRAAAAAP